MIKLKSHTSRLGIKGVAYYDAPTAYAKGKLNPKEQLKLIPDPQNPHDHNAVKIMTMTNKMLGHISKDIAPKYQKLCLEEKILHAAIHEIDYDKRSNALRIYINVTYFAWSQEVHSEIPETPGVYSISLGDDSYYIGSSQNLRARAKKHMSQLLSGIHKNKALQLNFQELERFKFSILKSTNNRDEALREEAKFIREYLRLGKNLLNKTIDGKGVKNTRGSLVTISDLYKSTLTRDELCTPSIIGNNEEKNKSTPRLAETIKKSTNSKDQSGDEADAVSTEHLHVDTERQKTTAPFPPVLVCPECQRDITLNSTALVEVEYCPFCAANLNPHARTPDNKSATASFWHWDNECFNCGKNFSVTLRYDEPHAICPSCSHGNSAAEHPPPAEDESIDEEIQPMVPKVRTDATSTPSESTSQVAKTDTAAKHRQSPKVATTVVSKIKTESDPKAVEPAPKPRKNKAVPVHGYTVKLFEITCGNCKEKSIAASTLNFTCPNCNNQAPVNLKKNSDFRPK
jgi:predicted GIY-YIG superfamily endonuclease/uncharacterized CHY-type Zn-finger protein